VISTSGGELGMLQLGNQLMKVVNIKHIFHMHDPVQYSFFEGIWIGSKFHLNRTKRVQNELSLPNKVVVTSENTTKSVREINKETCFDYLGIDNFRNISEKKILNTSYVNIFYAGSFGKYQNPLKHINNLLIIKEVNLHFIGNTDAEKKRITTSLLKINPDYKTRVFFHGRMNKSDADEIIFNKADYILVPLDMQFLKFNFPSKIYDSLNLVTPILFDLPEGSAKKFIINNNIGFDLTSDKNTLLKNIKDANAYELLLNNIISIREDYKMEDRILQLIR
jgi:hypothetical protein